VVSPTVAEERETWSERRRSARTGRHRALIRSLACAVALAAVYTVWTAFVEPARQVVPDELVGYWRSSSSQYGDRALYLAPHAVALDRGPTAGSEGYPVEKVTTGNEGTNRAVTIVYRLPDGMQDQLAILYHPATGTLTFKNQPTLRWNKYRDGK